MNIGFLGLGTMGKAMAFRLHEAGHRVSVWNRSTEAAAALQLAGATVVATPESMNEDIDVLISMLADDDATRLVVLESGVLDRLTPGSTHINMATVSVRCARDLERVHRDLGIHYIAAPVLGRVEAAIAGQLNILVAGNAQAIARVQVIFDILGQKTWLIGSKPEQANVLKLAINTMIAGAIESMAEGATLAEGYGVSTDFFINLVTSTGFAAPIYKLYGAAIAQEQFLPAGFKLALGYKDVRLTMEAADDVHVPLPLASILRDSHLDALAHGEGALDWAALSQVSKRRAGQG